jgi:hypothetical protein
VDRADRVEANENRFRDVNERIAELEEHEGVPVEVLCECDRMSCIERLQLSAEEYEGVRAHGDRFIVVPGHERPEDEIVIHERPGYLVVKKIGEAGADAKRDDPRRGA